MVGAPYRPIGVSAYRRVGVWACGRVGDNYTIAPLDKKSQMYQEINAQVTNTWQHEAGWAHDKYAPARLVKGTPAGAGQTNINLARGQSFAHFPLLKLENLF